MPMAIAMKMETRLRAGNMGVSCCTVHTMTGTTGTKTHAHPNKLLTVQYSNSSSNDVLPCLDTTKREHISWHKVHWHALLEQIQLLHPLVRYTSNGDVDSRGDGISRDDRPLEGMDESDHVLKNKGKENSQCPHGTRI